MTNYLDRRRFLQTAGLTAAALVVNGCGISPSNANSKSPSGKPNIILVMADDQGFGDVGYYGHPVLKTPNLDSMAATSLRFDRFYAAAPVCSPTRASVVTGRHPNRTGCFSWGHSIRPQEITIAQALKSKGYKTGHFGKWHIGSVYKNSPVNPGACGLMPLSISFAITQKKQIPFWPSSGLDLRIFPTKQMISSANPTPVKRKRKPSTAKYLESISLLGNFVTNSKNSTSKKTPSSGTAATTAD
jgi:hypothetical protein